MKNALKIVEFMKTVEQLCLVERDNLMSSGRQETDADHIFKLAFLVLMIHPYLKRPADCAKMLELALVHDLVEARTGDYSLSAQTARPELKARKKAAEKEAILYYRSVLPPPLNERVYGLFMEYEARETREAKLCAGDLLIGAIVETTNGRGSVKQASGRVMIEHEEDLAVAVPLTEQMLLPTGEVRQVRSLEFWGLEIPLGPDPVGETRTETREHRLTAFGTPLPVVLIVQEHSLLEEQEVTRTEAEAEALAEQQLAELEQTQLGQAEVLERVLTGTVDGNVFLLRGHYLVLEDAALERQFEVNQ